jgi:hypothetical protein
MRLTGSRHRAKTHQRIIAFVMLLCFAVSYLPVTNYWYLTFNGTQDLTRLLASMIRVKIDMDHQTPDRSVNQNLDNMFKELKIATGQIAPETPSGTGKIALVQIAPEFPLKPSPFSLYMYKKYQFCLYLFENNYQSVFLSIDTPPPEILFA